MKFLSDIDVAYYHINVNNLRVAIRDEYNIGWWVFDRLYLSM